MAQCTAKSKRTGERCKRFCAPGKTVCKWHGGNSNGAPKGNKNALKHGAYQAISLETMYPDEIAYVESVNTDPIDSLREQLKILRVKEMRIAKRMKAALDADATAGSDDGQGGKHPRMVTISATQVQSENFAGEKSKSVTTASETHTLHYLRLEQAHSLVMDQIRRVIDSITKLQPPNNDGLSGIIFKADM